MVYRGYYYEKNLCVMITHYNVFRRFFRTVYIITITYEQIMNAQLTFRLFAQFILSFYIFFREITHIFNSRINYPLYILYILCIPLHSHPLRCLIQLKRLFAKSTSLCRIPFTSSFPMPISSSLS